MIALQLSFVKRKSHTYVWAMLHTDNTRHPSLLETTETQPPIISQNQSRGFGTKTGVPVRLWKL